LSRLLMSGGNASAKMKREVNRVRFFRSSMSDQHITAERGESTVSAAAVTTGLLKNFTRSVSAFTRSSM